MEELRKLGGIVFTSVFAGFGKITVMACGRIIEPQT
jgi:hypothetical protein